MYRYILYLLSMLFILVGIAAMASAIIQGQTLSGISLSTEELTYLYSGQYYFSITTGIFFWIASCNIKTARYTLISSFCAMAIILIITTYKILFLGNLFLPTPFIILLIGFALCTIGIISTNQNKQPD